MDILFVVQTSQSIDDVKPAIVSGINNFVSNFPANSDFNIAVLLSHGSTSSYSGVLYQAGGEPVVLKSSQLSISQIETYLDTKLNQVVQDPDSGGGEEGMFSLFHGITTPSLLSASQAAGFFRPTAALGIVFIADRRDICAALPAGVPAETDPTKIAARARDCEGLTATGLTYQLTQLKGSAPEIVSGIIYARQPVPAGKEIGYGYIDMINLNHGVGIDIAQDNIASGLASIRQLGGQGTSNQNVFTLSHSGVDPSTIAVTVNGAQASFQISGNQVTVTSSIPASGTVVISYCLKPTPPPVADDCVSNGLSQKACYLMKIMELGCPLRDDRPEGYKAPNRAQIISYMKRCDANAYPMTTPTSSQLSVINRLIDPNNSFFRQKLFTDLYYKPLATDDFKKFFGVELYNAEYVFCDNYGVPPGAGSILPKAAINPDHGQYVIDSAYKAANVYAQELQNCVYNSKSER